MMRRRRALVVDVAVTVLDVLRHFLAVKGYEVVTRNGPVPCLLPETSADACCRKVPCADMIITEINTTRMNGLELLLRQRRLGCSVDVRNKAIIAGSIDVEHRRKLEELGCAWFSIPIDFAQLSNWIDECNSRNASA
jgi:CheY-like chemotaxis protein